MTPPPQESLHAADSRRAGDAGAEAHVSRRSAQVAALRVVSRGAAEDYRRYAGQPERQDLALRKIAVAWSKSRQFAAEAVAWEGIGDPIVCPGCVCGPCGRAGPEDLWILDGIGGGDRWFEAPDSSW